MVAICKDRANRGPGTGFAYAPAPCHLPGRVGVVPTPWGGAKYYPLGWCFGGLSCYNTPAGQYRPALLKEAL